VKRLTVVPRFPRNPAKLLASTFAAVTLAASLMVGGSAFAAGCYNQYNVSVFFGYVNWAGIGISGSWTVNSNGTLTLGGTSPSVYAAIPLSWQGVGSEWAIATSTYGEAEAQGILVDSVGGVILGESTKTVDCNT